MFQKKIHTDIFGLAVSDYYRTGRNRQIHVYSDIARKEHIDSSYLFRDYENMPELEKKALDLCHGQILDIGAGAGCHSVILKERGFDVTALESSKLCCEILSKRGLDKIVCQDIWNYDGSKYDTLLLLMNGIGLSGTLLKLPAFLHSLKKLLKPDGVIISDSVDIRPLFEKTKTKHWSNSYDHYLGEAIYKIQYKNYYSSHFPWLFIDKSTLGIVAKKVGYNLEIVHTEDKGRKYLAKILHQ